MTWRIVSDSSCDMRMEDFTHEQITFATVPLKIIVGETEYVDEPQTDVSEMLRHMQSFKGASTSACPSPEEFAEEFRKGDCIIAPILTGGLSGTYNSAVQARELVLEEYPEKKIFVFDSHGTSGMLVLLVRKAVELIDAGLDFEAVQAQLEAYNKTIHIVFTLSDFDNLVKTGRMSKVAGLVASALGIRAVAQNTPQGEIAVLDKVRGLEKAIQRIVALLPTVKDPRGMPVVISHCGNLAGALQMKEALEKAFGNEDITLIETRCLTSFYAGPSGILLSY